MPELRQQPRVAYQTRIRLRALDREQSVVARVQNLSVGGIFVTAAEMPAAGSPVLCRLSLAGERRTLRGRVAWVKRLADVGVDEGAGAGIQFVDLTPKDTDLLARLVEPPPEDQRAVDVWFEGLQAPIRSQAVVMAEGVRLSTRLPFLRLSSEVRISFVQHGVEELRTGTLDSVTLQPSSEDGVPRLHLNVSTPMLESVQGTIEVASAADERLDALLFEHQPRMVVDPAAMVPPPSPGAVVTDRDQTQRFRWGTDSIERIPSGVTSPSTASVSEATQRFRWEPPPPAQPAPKRRSRVLGLIGSVVLLAAVGSGGWLIGRATRAEPIVVAAPPPVVVAAPVAVPEAPRPAVEIQPLPAEPVPEAEAAPEPARDFTVETSGRHRTLVLPLVGVTRGLQRYALQRPAGTGMNLPRGRPRLAPGIYKPGAPFDLLQIQRRGAGAHVRVHHAASLVTEVESVDGALRITLRPR